MVRMINIIFCNLVHWTKVSSASEGLTINKVYKCTRTTPNHIIKIISDKSGDYNGLTIPSGKG